MTAKKPLPALPKEVLLPAGPYKVVRAEIEHLPGERHGTIWGQCDYEARVITIRPGISRATAWLTLEHEKAHAILFDAGVKLRDSHEESVCDAIGAHRVYEMQQP